MNKRKIIFWIAMVIIGAAITSYAFYTDDWEEKRRPGYKSTDSIQMVIGVFTFYTLLFTGVIGGSMYVFFSRYLNRPSKTAQ